MSDLRQQAQRLVELYAETAKRELAEDEWGELEYLLTYKSRAYASAYLAECEAHEQTREQKNGAYAERDKLVSLISKMFPASLERHQPENDPDWDEEWKWLVIIDLPTGQASWHIHDSELPLFGHLPCKTGRAWDGHTTEEKYERVARVPVDKTQAMMVNYLRSVAKSCEECNGTGYLMQEFTPTNQSPRCYKCLVPRNILASIEQKEAVQDA